MATNTAKARVLITFFLVLFTFQNTFSQTGTHLNLDGVDDGISFTGIGFPSGNQARTVEAWIKTSQNNSGSCIFSYGNVGTNQRFALYQMNGKLNFVTLGLNYNSNVTISDDIWHHVAATFDGTNLKLYVDGVQAGSTQAITLATAGEAGTIGFVIGLAEHYNGNIDEVRVWNVARSGADIIRTMNCEVLTSETGLWAYYKFNQGIGGQPNASTTTLTNATSIAGLNGTLSGFALSGTSSNWLAGSVMSILPAHLIYHHISELAKLIAKAL